jgi:hypothetical protein
VVVAAAGDTDGDDDFVLLAHALSASTSIATTSPPGRRTNIERTCIGRISGGALGYAPRFPAA